MQPDGTELPANIWREAAAVPMSPQVRAEFDSLRRKDQSGTELTPHERRRALVLFRAARHVHDEASERRLVRQRDVSDLLAELDKLK